MVNVIPLDHVDDVPIVELNQHNDVLAVTEPVLVDEDKDPEEDDFEEEEDPQEEEDDMKVDIEEDENEPELTYPYEEVDPLNPPPPDEIKVEDAVKFEDETFPASIHEVGESSTAPFLCEDSDGLLPGLIGRDINSLFGRMASLSRQLCGRETAHALVEKKGKAKDEYCAKIEEARFSNTFLRMQNERVERDLYWTRVQAHEFYQEMIHRGFVFEERPNEVINVRIEDEKSPSSEPQGSPHDAYVDAAIAAERARQANVRNDASGSGPVRGAVELRRWFEKTKSVFKISECAEGKKVKFAAATLEGPALTWWKTKVATMGLETVNQMPWTEMKQLMTTKFCPIEEVQRMEHELMVEPERVKVDAYIWGLTDNIKGEVTYSKHADLNEAVCMAHKLMEQKSQARDERILEGKKRKWESFQSGNSSGKGNQKDNSRQTLENSQKQWNARAMVTAPTNGKLPLCEQ
ncbi:hypothetical protein Tco_1350034 [Tanacetum coccineum]